MSGASKRANGQANGPVLTSGILIILDYSTAVIFLGQYTWLEYANELPRFEIGRDTEVDLRKEVGVHGHSAVNPRSRDAPHVRPRSKSHQVSGQTGTNNVFVRLSLLPSVL